LSHLVNNYDKGTPLEFLFTIVSDSLNMKRSPILPSGLAKLNLMGKIGQHNYFMSVFWIGFFCSSSSLEHGTPSVKPPFCWPLKMKLTILWVYPIYSVVLASLILTLFGVHESRVVLLKPLCLAFYYSRDPFILCFLYQTINHILPSCTLSIWHIAQNFSLKNDHSCLIFCQLM